LWWKGTVNDSINGITQIFQDKNWQQIGSQKTLSSPVLMILELRAASQFKDCPKMRSYIVLEQDVYIRAILMNFCITIMNLKRRSILQGIVCK
jgi:hypothetical protein